MWLHLEQPLGYLYSHQTNRTFPPRSQLQLRGDGGGARMANEQQINVPSLVVILVLSGLIIRYLFFSTPAPQQTRDPISALRSREVAVERIQQMFPQVERRTILWDLQRNGGNIAATTERILAGRLETVSSPLESPLC